MLHLLSLSSHFLFFLFINVEEKEKSIILENYQMDWLIGMDIISRHIFSRLFLKTKLYKHHIVSLFICAPGFIIISICFHNNFIFSFFHFFNSLRGSPQDVPSNPCWRNSQHCSYCYWQSCLRGWGYRSTYPDRWGRTRDPGSRSRMNSSTQNRYLPQHS